LEKDRPAVEARARKEVTSMAKRSEAREKRILTLLGSFAAAAAGAQRQADNMRLLAMSVSTLVMNSPAANGTNDEPTAADNKDLDDQLDALEDFLSKQPQWLGNSQCREILEGMGDAARIGDAAGAARAMAAYIKCMQRPRPKVQTPGPGSDF